MDMDELEARGLALRRSLFGAETVDQRMKQLGEFGAPLQRLINACSYGDVWQRPDLPLRDKSLVMLGICAALGKQNELKVHVRGALGNGVTPEQVRDALLLVALYCGLPAAIDAHKSALEIIEAGARD
jgi:4-carboxymuconolactone decarboxylase